MASKYKSNSVYKKTPANKKYLENYVPPVQISANNTEIITLESKYKHRPDLLAYDRYGDANLWWIFILYNRNTIVDSIYDFEPGIKLRVPINSSSIGV